MSCNEIIEMIKEKTGKMSYRLIFNEDTSPKLQDSKLGGIPYWTEDLEYPLSEDGEKLALLIQLNFEQLKFEAPLPKNGILQIFVPMNDYQCGSDWEEPDVQKNFKLIYHETVDYEITIEQVLDMEVLNPKDYSDLEFYPVKKECSISYQQEMTFIDPQDYRFEEFFEELAEEYDISDEDEDEIIEAIAQEGSRILGNPSFVQEDERDEDTSYNTLLLQLDSESDEVLNCGDSGILSFFINEDDLKDLSFNNVMYIAANC